MSEDLNDASLLASRQFFSSMNRYTSADLSRTTDYKRKLKQIDQFPLSRSPRKPSEQPMNQLVATSGIPNIPQKTTKQLLALYKKPQHVVRPAWHAPWKLSKVISGHLQWVRCIDVDPTNEWFATGSNDATIKIWDLASGQLKLTLTGHTHHIRDLTVSPRHPYMFSVSEDKTVKCWDLEQNKVIRSYHGHLSGVYSCDLHPSLDVLVTSGRDSSARVWDMRTRKNIYVLSGHQNTVSSVKCQNVDPQVITGSHDSTIRCWDLRTGRTTAILTHHKKSIRSLLVHPEEYSFASAAPDNIKVWKCPEAQFVRNVSGHNAIVECLALNQDNVMVSGGDDGTLCFWDWKTGYKFQTAHNVVQPGSADFESGILDCAFDKSGSRLITCGVDKTIKIWKEDEKASMSTHPIDMSQVQQNQDHF